MTESTPEVKSTPTSANLQGKAFLDFPFQNGQQFGVKLAPIKRPRRFRPKDRFGMVIHFLGWADELFQKTEYDPKPETLDVAVRLAFKGYARATGIRGAEKASVWRMVLVQVKLLKQDLRNPNLPLLGTPASTVEEKLVESMGQAVEIAKEATQ